MQMQYKHIVVLTGAGISAESGIPVFRSETGLWEQERIEDVCVPEALVRNPLKVHDFYNRMRASLAQKQPNEAHRALALLQKKLREIPGTELTLVTQNIDDLHERAGSDGVCHMHGELLSMLSQNCGKRFKFAGRSHPDDICPHCKKRGGVRPDIVFFGEMPYHMEFIEEKLAACDLFLAVGTSGVVYPAAGFCRFAKSRGALCVEFNLEKSAVATDFDYGLYGKASITLKAFTEELMKSGTALSQLPR